MHPFQHISVGNGSTKLLENGYRIFNVTKAVYIIILNAFRICTSITHCSCVPGEKFETTSRIILFALRTQTRTDTQATSLSAFLMPSMVIAKPYSTRPLCFSHQMLLD